MKLETFAGLTRIKGLKYEKSNDEAYLLNQFKNSCQRRNMRETKLNKTSSRSHAIFSI